MNPLEWLATLLWDRDGRKRREQAMRIARGARKRREFDTVHGEAMKQIQRTQEAARQVTR